MNKLFLYSGLFLLFFSLVTGCSSLSGDHYSREEARKVQHYQTGVITQIDMVTIEGTKTPVGAIGGAAIGGIAGSTIGGGTGRTLATVAGGIVGGLGGAALEEGMTRKQGMEITVSLDNGEKIIVVQEAGEQFQPGQRVKVVSGQDGITRVRPF